MHPWESLLTLSELNFAVCNMEIVSYRIIMRIELYNTCKHYHKGRPGVLFSILSYILFLIYHVFNTCFLSSTEQHFVISVFGTFDVITHNEWHFPSITFISLRSGVIFSHNSLIHLFIQQTVIEHLLNPGPWARPMRYNYHLN